MGRGDVVDLVKKKTFEHAVNSDVRDRGGNQSSVVEEEFGTRIFGLGLGVEG